MNAEERARLRALVDDDLGLHAHEAKALLDALDASEAAVQAQVESHDAWAASWSAKLAQAEARVKELEAEAKQRMEFLADATAENAALRKRLGTAEKALEPFARDLHQEANFHHNFGVVVNGPTPDRHLITLLASDFDAARAALAAIRARASETEGM